MNKNRRISKVSIKPTKEVRDRIVIYYQLMYKDKDFDTMCAFNRIQYSINSISKDTISK